MAGGLGIGGVSNIRAIPVDRCANPARTWTEVAKWYWLQSTLCCKVHGI